MTLPFISGVFKILPRTLAAAAAAWVLAGAAYAQPAPQPQNIVKPEDIQKLKDDATKVADAWAEKGEEPADIHKRTYGWSYDAKCVDALKKMVAELPPGAGKTAQRYYVLNLIVGPLGNSSKDVIRLALPILKPIPTIEAYKKQLTEPVMKDPEAVKMYATPNLSRISPEEALKLLEQVDNRRQGKAAHEHAVIRQNEQVAAFERTKYGLMFMADDEKEDADLVRIIFNSENDKSKSFSWTYIRDMFDGQLKNKTVSKERCKKFYGQFAKSVEAVRWADKRTYVDYSKGRLSLAGNSHFWVSDNMYFGGQAMGLMNSFAAECGEKAAKIPTPGDPKTGWNPPAPHK